MGPKVNTNPSRAAIENSSEQRKSAAPIPAPAAIPPWLRVERSTTETMKGTSGSATHRMVTQKESGNSLGCNGFSVRISLSAMKENSQ